MSEQLLKEKGAVIPQFFTESQPNPFRTNQEGRPCFDDVELVRIIIPGDRNNQPVERVSDDHRTRWPKEYAAYKEGREIPLDGTPLAEWPPISRSQVEELAFFNIRTVEQLAGVNDAHLHKLPMGVRELRAQAVTFVDVAENGTGPIARMVAENLALRDELQVKGRLLDEANARIKELEVTHARADS